MNVQSLVATFGPYAVALVVYMVITGVLHALATWFGGPSFATNWPNLHKFLTASRINPVAMIESVQSSIPTPKPPTGGGALLVVMLAIGSGVLVAVVSVSGCSAAVADSAKVVNATAGFLDDAEPALAASERAALRAVIDSATNRDDAEAKVMKLSAAYAKAWQAYHIARDAEIAGMQAVKAAELDSNGGTLAITAAVAQMVAAEADFAAVVKDIEGLSAPASDAGSGGAR